MSNRFFGMIIASFVLAVPFIALGAVTQKDYSIIKDVKEKQIKRSIDVRLKKELKEEDLRGLANILNDDTVNYPKVFICYYLPNQTVGNGAWATTHFNQQVEVKINGATAEQKKQMNSKSEVKSGEQIIGKWYDSTPYIAGTYTILKKDKAFVMRSIYKDGSTREIKLVKRSDKRFDEHEDEGQQYYVIDGSGNLKVYDEFGLISTMQKQ